MLFIRLTIHAFLAAALLASIGCDRKPAPSATTREAIPTEAPTPKPAARTDDAASVGAIPTGDMGGSGDSDARVVVPRVDLSRLDASAQAQIQRAQQLVEEAPGSAGRLCELGMQYLAFGFNEAAIECFNGAIDRIPKAREYHYLRGLANESLGNSDAAEADFRATIQLAPDYVAAYVNLGNLLRRRNDTSACDMFEKAHELDPDDVIALCGLAECRANDQQDDAAETLLKRAVELQPENEDAHQALSKLYERRGDAALAKQHLEAARNGRKPVVTNDPIRFELVRRTRSEKDIAREAIEMAESGAVERAAVYLERAITHGIDGAEIHHALGGIYLSQRKFHLALTHLRESVRLAPDAVEMRSSLGRALAETGDLDAAETIFREIIEKTPNDAVTMNRLAMLQSRKGKPVEAEATLRKAVEADPDSSASRLNLADLLINTRRADEATAILNPISSSSPGYGKKLFLLGLVDARAGRLDDAELKWREAISKSPDTEQAYLALSELTATRGTRADTLAILMRGLQNIPSSPTLQNNAAWILATSPNEKLRNGELAVKLAEAANANDNNRRDNFVGTLAAAYAEVGRFEEAERTARRAAELARAAGADAAASHHETAAALYAQRKPYRDMSSER